MNHNANRTKILIITTLCIFALSWETANADILQVPSDKYPTIQSALDAAFSEDKIFVAAGEYKENITITSGVELIGAGQEVTTIVGTTGAHVVILNAPGISPVISGFTIRGGLSGITGGRTIINVTITDVDGDGINGSGTFDNVTITQVGAMGLREVAHSTT